MKKICLIALAVAFAGTCFAQSQPKGTIWLGTSLMYETEWMPPQNFTWAFGFAGVVVDRNRGNNEGRVGLAAEAIFYQERQPRGLAFVARAGAVDGGLYAAPGVYVVSRPRDPHMISWRGGVLVPLGGIGDGNIIPATAELSIGFRF
ncbi:MAG TPA: hypothetical protein VNI20_13985 [Fimbriimonadaceae bacterium]|nr:hypothetical protein [Fimbriimonadaceae bacterium]